MPCVYLLLYQLKSADVLARAFFSHTIGSCAMCLCSSDGIEVDQQANGSGCLGLAGLYLFE